MSAVAIEHLAVWDVREKSWMTWCRPLRTAWLKDHGLPADDMYRCEFYLIDTPFARIFCYHRDEQGDRHRAIGHFPDRPHDHDQCGPCELPPRDVILSELPPPELLKVP